MQTIPTSWENIISGAYETVVRLKIFDKLGSAHLIYKDKLTSLKTYTRVFGDDFMSVGNCVSGEIDVEMIKPTDFLIPTMAKMQIEVTVKNAELQSSDWIKRGVFFIDTREEDGAAQQEVRMKIHGYDAMLKAEAAFPISVNHTWPATDVQMLSDIAAAIGVSIDERTLAAMNLGYMFPFPDDYSCREVLGFIGSAYAGNFIISDKGELRLIQLNDLPVLTNYLITENGNPITFGGVRILV